MIMIIILMPKVNYLNIAIILTLDCILIILLDSAEYFEEDNFIHKQKNLKFS